MMVKVICYQELVTPLKSKSEIVNAADICQLPHHHQRGRCTSVNAWHEYFPFGVREKWEKYSSQFSTGSRAIVALLLWGVTLIQADRVIALLS